MHTKVPAQQAKQNQSSTEHKSPESALPQFEDARPAAATQMRMQSLMAGSAQTAQLKSTQAMMAAKPNNTGLPNQLKAGVENLSGMSMDHVRVHYNSDKPAQLQAHAYAQGSEIHVAPGQEKHLPHEAWHVVQQAQGRVKPTMQMKDAVPVNDDAGLEQEADVMGEKALGVGQLVSQSGAAQLVHQDVSGGASVAQLAPAYKQITGVTHLVTLNENGSLYNGDKYEDNEYSEVTDGTVLQVEDAGAIFSRRGPNQEEFSGEDEDGPQHYQWFPVLKLNGSPVPENVYVREDTIIDYSEGESLIANMTAMLDMPKMQWNGSGDKGFEDWSKDEGPEPETANCWNAILYAAHKSKLVDKGYIQRVNEGGKTELGPELVNKIVGSPAGRFLKNNGETAEAFQQRVATAGPDIPRGMVVVFHSTGFHVALSLGGGQLMELDKQALVTVVNPNYNPNYIKENAKFNADLNKLKTRASKQAEYQQKLLEYETWKTANSRDQTFTKRMDNELRQVSLTPGLNHYLLMLNLDGIYWGNLPSL